MRGFLPFLKDAWRLALPYFRSEERWSARGLLGVIIVMNLARISHKLQAKSNWCRNVIVLPANLPAADRVAA